MLSLSRKFELIRIYSWKTTVVELLIQLNSFAICLHANTTTSTLVVHKGLETLLTSWPILRQDDYMSHSSQPMWRMGLFDLCDVKLLHMVIIPASLLSSWDGNGVSSEKASSNTKCRLWSWIGSLAIRNFSPCYHALLILGPRLIHIQIVSCSNTLANKQLIRIRVSFPWLEYCSL